MKVFTRKTARIFKTLSYAQTNSYDLSVVLNDRDAIGILRQLRYLRRLKLVTTVSPSVSGTEGLRDRWRLSREGELVLKELL